MKKALVATTALGLFALSVTSVSALEQENRKEVTNKTDVTLTAGSGTNVEPVIDDDTHDDHPETGDMGSLSIPYASNITFGQQEIQQGDTDYYALNKKPFVQVNDTRGGAKGWTLSVKKTPFIGKNGKELTGARMFLMNGKVITKNNQSEAPTLASEMFELNSDVQDFMDAKVGQGAGAFAAVFEGQDGKNENVKLHVPRAGVEAQSYTADITWVLTDAAN